MDMNAAQGCQRFTSSTGSATMADIVIRSVALESKEQEKGEG